MDPVSRIGLQLPISSAAKAVAPAAAGAPGFADLVKQSLDKVSEMQAESTELAKKVQLDDPSVSLEESMIAIQKSGLAFQAVVQVRNKLVQAYHDVMNMAV